MDDRLQRIKEVVEKVNQRPRGEGKIQEATKLFVYATTALDEIRAILEEPTPEGEKGDSLAEFDLADRGIIGHAPTPKECELTQDCNVCWKLAMREAKYRGMGGVTKDTALHAEIDAHLKGHAAEREKTHNSAFKEPTEEKCECDFCGDDCSFDHLPECPLYSKPPKEPECTPEKRCWMNPPMELCPKHYGPGWAQHQDSEWKPGQLKVVPGVCGYGCPKPCPKHDKERAALKKQPPSSSGDSECTCGANDPSVLKHPDDCTCRHGRAR